MKHVMYSARTGKYYIATQGDQTYTNGIYVVASSTGTLATATFTTNYYVGVGYAGSDANCPMTMVDNGTNVGICCTVNGSVHSFYYGASFNTASTALLTAAQVYSPVNVATVGAKSFWLNNTLISIAGNSNGISPILAVATGATCSTGISANLHFPLMASFPVNGASMLQWSGLTYMGGSFYAVNGQTYYSSSEWYGYWTFMYKMNAAMTLLSCPVAPIQTPIGPISYPNSLGMSSGRLTSGGTGVVWAGYINTTNAYLGFNTLFVFNGTTFVASVINTSSPVNAATLSNSLELITGQPASCLTLPKWSSLLNAYVQSSPPSQYDSNQINSANVSSSATLSGTPTVLMNPMAGNTNTNVLALDVLSNGIPVGIFSGYVSTWQYYAMINNGTQNFNLGSVYGVGGTIFGMWEIDSGGFTYLVIINGTVMWVWRVAVGGAPVPIISGLTLQGNAIVSNSTGLRRVFSYNGSFYLADTGITSGRNSYVLTPSGPTFNVALAEFYMPGDTNPLVLQTHTQIRQALQSLTRLLRRLFTFQLV